MQDTSLQPESWADRLAITIFVFSHFSDVIIFLVIRCIARSVDQIGLHQPESFLTYAKKYELSLPAPALVPGSGLDELVLQLMVVTACTICYNIISAATVTLSAA